MGAQDIQGYTRYTVLPGQTWVNKIYRGIQGIQYYQGKHGYTRYIGVYKGNSITRVNMGTQDIQGYTRVYSITRVNMGTQDIQGYTGYTVLLG